MQKLKLWRRAVKLYKNLIVLLSMHVYTQMKRKALHNTLYLLTLRVLSIHYITIYLSLVLVVYTYFSLRISIFSLNMQSDSTNLGFFLQ